MEEKKKTNLLFLLTHGIRISGRNPKESTKKKENHTEIGSSVRTYDNNKSKDEASMWRGGAGRNVGRVGGAEGRVEMMQIQYSCLKSANKHFKKIEEKLKRFLCS